MNVNDAMQVGGVAKSVGFDYATKIGGPVVPFKGCIRNLVVGSQVRNRSV